MKRRGEALKIAVNCMGDVNLKVEYWENFANTQTGISKTFVSMRMPRERRQHTYLLIYFILVIFFVYKWLDFLYNFVSNKSSIYLLSKTKKTTHLQIMIPDIRCGNRGYSAGCETDQCNIKYMCGIVEGMHYPKKHCELDMSCPSQVSSLIPSQMPKLTVMRLLLGAITVISMIAQFYV